MKTFQTAGQVEFLVGLFLVSNSDLPCLSLSPSRFRAFTIPPYMHGTDWYSTVGFIFDTRNNSAEELGVRILSGIVLRVFFYFHLSLVTERVEGWNNNSIFLISICEDLGD
jgi:hypothetical protein